MALSVEEKAIFTKLQADAAANEPRDERNSRYYEGTNRLEQLGIAVPPELRRFVTIVNWPRVVVDTIERRQDVKSLIMPGDNSASAVLREGWDYNNLDSELSLWNKDRLIYGRGFMSVGANEEDPEHPLITVESPREMTPLINTRHRRMDALLRLYVSTPGELTADLATLYLPNVTIWLERGNNGWVQVDRDEHKLGKVAAVMSLNRRRTGNWAGISEMADVIPLSDAAARSLTNLQIAGETNAIPQKYVTGASRGDFIDDAGNLVPAWEAYFSAVWAHGDKDTKVGQLPESDLSNFHNTVNHYGTLAASVTGFPGRFFGASTTNPPAEGTVRAEEAQMVKSVERQNRDAGSGIGWAMALYERIRTGVWPDGNRIKCEWFDPGTPTMAQRADAVQKLAGGVQIMSRQGAWDELGWSDERKLRERGYFEEEASDPTLERIARDLGTGADGNA